MAIRKQNRTLLILVVFILLILGYVLFREGKLNSLFGMQSDTESNSDENKASGQDQMGDQLKDQNGELGNQDQAPVAANELENNEMQKSFKQILVGMAECLDIKSPQASGPIAVQVETLFQQFQGELGPVSHQADRWMNWSLRNREGKERRLRLEITENDEGKIGRELHYFAVDRDGQPEPLEIEAEKANNPSDETVSQMLKEGEVFYKERAAFALFPGGERLEYVEKNGELSEIEFIRGEKYYRCQDLKSQDSCQCSN